MMENKLGIYVHIPFCVKKCNYCAFLSSESSEEEREKYVQALAEEIRRCKVNFTSQKEDATEKCKVNFTSNNPSVDTIYIGGGTPSILETSQIERILTEIFNTFNVDSNSEITIEANPGTLGKTDYEIMDKLKAYESMGINRLSMGVQSMDDDVLRYLGRIHTSLDVKKDFEFARKVGFDNINLDLILSVPYNDPLKNALSDVEKIQELSPEHFSCYSLQLEEGTQFFNQYEAGKFKEVSDELDREIYHQVCESLKNAGYTHYEISNFAKVGNESKHNSKYWNMSEYFGFGLGASGFVAGIRYKNTEKIKEYLNGQTVFEKHVNTEYDNISEGVFLGLRRLDGIKYIEIFPRAENPEKEFWNYYSDVRREVEAFVDTGHLVIDSEGIRITEKGIDISNKIMANFV